MTAHPSVGAIALGDPRRVAMAGACAALLMACTPVAPPALPLGGLEGMRQAQQAQFPNSLPFITVADDQEFVGRYFLAEGGSEATEIRSSGEWAAFLARHPRVLHPLRPQVAPPFGALVGPRPVPTPTPFPESAPRAWPEGLARVDFAMHRLVVMLDASLPEGSTARITSVVAEGGRWQVQATRWLPHPALAYGPDRHARFHAILLPKAGPPLRFLQAESRWVAEPFLQEGGAIRLAFPPSRRAVPHPEVTEARVKKAFQKRFGEGAEIEVQKRSFAWLEKEWGLAHGMPEFTLESEVWVVLMLGLLPREAQNPVDVLAPVATPIVPSHHFDRVLQLVSIEWGSTQTAMASWPAAAHRDWVNKRLAK